MNLIFSILVPGFILGCWIGSTRWMLEQIRSYGFLECAKETIIAIGILLLGIVMLAIGCFVVMIFFEVCFNAQPWYGPS
jgi:hypothetical protein